jgi:chromate transporter
MIVKNISGMDGPPAKPTFRKAFIFWLKLGFISFGGPAGQIAIMHEYLVEKEKWISDSRFLHGLNYCMLLPGPEAQQLATYIGWLLHGLRGGLTAGILFILPSIFIMLGLSIAYVAFGKLEWVVPIFYGLKPAIIAIIILALIKIAKKSLVSGFHYAVGLFSFICIFFFHVSFPWIIMAAILAGILAQRLAPQWLRPSRSSAKGKADEFSYYLNAFSPPIPYALTLKSLVTKITVGIFLWFVPFLLFIALRADHSFWQTLTSFFTKAALVTFGGAYAVLPYVAQESVEKHHWLTQFEMIDGLALGESTPGPLIMVLVFVGFMAGYHHGGSSLMEGALGLLTTAWYTFLPCFLFIFIGAPWVEKTKGNENLSSVLAIITAAVVGVILNLTIYFGKVVLFPAGFDQPDWFSLLWLIISVIALFKFKVNMILWIGLSAVAGLLYHFVLLCIF